MPKLGYNDLNATENMMTSVTVTYLDPESNLVTVTESTSLYVEPGEVWDYSELERFCELEMVDLVC